MQPIRKRVAGHRQRLRAAGLRPVQIWVPDTRRPGFAEECRRQSLRLREDPAEQAVLHFVEEIGDWTDR
jgi:hypothetical protein